MKPYLLLLFSILLWNQTAFSAACCGGGSSAASLITGDDKAQLSTAYSFSEVAVDNIDSRGIWRKWDHHQEIQTLTVAGAHLITDRWQAGFSLPIIKRIRLDQSYSGLGDVATSLGYEYLPDWDYNPIRPKGIGYFQVTLPTGKSKAESEVGGLDSRGNGFFAIALGTILSKAIGSWDLFTSIDAHRSFSKTVNNSQVQGTLKPGYGGNFGVGAGFSYESLRLGGSITWTYEDPINITGSSNSNGSLERYATGAITLSYIANDNWSGTLSYADQTLFGSPINTSLGRSGSLQILRRWSR